jgi:hypothetical protein
VIEQCRLSKTIPTKTMTSFLPQLCRNKPPNAKAMAWCSAANGGDGRGLRDLPRPASAMTSATEHASCPVSSCTLRVRRHRQRRSRGLRLLTVTVPETVIQAAVARGLLASEERAEPWAVIQGCYASQLSDAALDRLVNGGGITHEQRGDAAAILRSISRWLEHSAWGAFEKE